MTTPTKTFHNQSKNSDRYSDLKKELSAWIKKRMKKHKVTGMSVALMDDGEIAWAQGFGYADKRNKRPADAGTLYKVGSISKVFTATAIMQLVEQGKVDLDVPIQTYIPELNPKYHFEVNKPVTLRHIMCHRSGLSGDKLAGMFTRKPERFDSVIEYLNSVYSPYAPGTVSAYSNLATDLQAITIERISGERFEDYVEKHILKPLSMNTSTFDDERVDTKLLSKAYKRNKESYEPALRDIPAGNLYSSVLELNRFANMVVKNGGTILEPKTLEQMLIPQVSDGETHDMGLNFGLNWIIERPTLKYLGKVASHSGGTINFMSNFVILLEQGLSVAILSNSAASMGFVNELTDKILIEAARIKSGITKPEPEPQSAETPFPEYLQQQLPGYYATLAGAVKFNASENSVKAKLMGLTVNLKHHEDGWMSLHPKLLGFIPLSIKAVKNIRIKIDHANQRPVLTAKYQDSILPAGIKAESYSIPEAWRSYLGRYTVDQPKGDHKWLNHLKLTEKDGFLFVSAKIDSQGTIKYIIRPLSDDMAVIEGLGRGMQETITVDHSEHTPIVSYSGYCFRKVK